MRLLHRVGSPEAAVGVVVAIVAVYMGLVVFGNITDYGTNRAFVQHVLAMDTTFGSPNTMWRAITDRSAVTAAYVLIIAWEALTALALFAAVGAWLGRRPVLGRALASTGLLMQLLLFGGGFIVIGGEWFQMWQSKDWNGLSAAFQNFVVASVALILVRLSTKD